MRYFFLFLFVFFLPKTIFSQENFFDFRKSLRIDFYLQGDANTDEVVLLQMKKEPYWGGSKKNLIFPNYGNFRLQLIDLETKNIVFSKGFSSLLSEWQDTDQAKVEKRVFSHVMQVPLPTKKLKLSIEKRTSGDSFEKKFEKEINPDDYFIKEEKVVSYPVKKILYNGDYSKKVDIVILAEGYAKEEINKFYKDAKRLTDYMFTISPFSNLKKDFNVYAIGVPSEESGTDVPGKHIYKKTAFNTSFYTFDMERYLTTNSMQEIADVASLAPYDQIYILVNTSMYGGGGFYNHLNLATSDHSLSDKVFVHEFGHGFAGLADEYYDSSTAFNTFYNSKVEPWEENITSLVDFDSKWKDLIDKSVPIPTPRNEEYKDVVGVFQGGGYVSEGIYSPVQDCRMKSNEAKGFCPVCQRAIRNVVKLYTD